MRVIYCKRLHGSVILSNGKLMNFSYTLKSVTICSLCGAILVATMNSLVCQNPKCPDYLLEKHEHVSEKYAVFDDSRMQTVSTSGTAASAATGSYGPVNFTKLADEGGES